MQKIGETQPIANTKVEEMTALLTKEKFKHSIQIETECYKCKH